jgi:hypothetical protein
MGVDLGAENRRSGEHGARSFQKAASGKGHKVRIADFRLWTDEAQSGVSLLRLGGGCSRNRAAPVLFLRKSGARLYFLEALRDCVGAHAGARRNTWANGPDSRSQIRARFR